MSTPTVSPPFFFRAGKPLQARFLLTVVAAALVALSAVACGDGATEPAPTPNRAPLPSGSIPALTVAVGEAVTVNVAGYFTDPDGDALTYTATSSNAQAATVAVSGSVVTVTATARGVVTVTVTARDPGGLSAQATFTVTVPNQAPVAVGTVPAQTVFVGDTAHVDMAAYFTDPDGDALIYSAASSNATAVPASVAGSVVSISAMATGVATITITATDPDRLSAQHNFEVTVPNRAPVGVGSLPAQTLAVGQTVVIDVSQHFEDPDNDSLTYAATTTDSAVAVAMVSDNVLTVTARARGTASVTVTATDPGSLSGQQSFDVTVPNQAPVVRDSIQSGTLGVGEIESWSGLDLFRDPDGDSLTYAAGSSNVEVVRPWVTDDVLLIQALSPGTATVTLRAFDPEGLSARIVFDVTVLGPVTISGTDPLVLLEGAPATVFGSGFSAAAELNQVLIGGLPTRVTAATETALSIVVPIADCLPPRRTGLHVTVGERTDLRTVSVTPRSKEDLELPQGWYKYTYAGNGCLHLPGNVSGGEYLVGVVSVSEDPALLTGVTLTGTRGDATVAGVEGSRIVVVAELGAEERSRPSTDFDESSRQLRPDLSATTSSLEALPEAGDTLVRQWGRAHGEVMARNEALLQKLGRLTRRTSASAGRKLEAGDTLTLHASSKWTCSNALQVTALVRRVGSSFVWLEDLGNPHGTFTDSELMGVEAFYDEYAKGVHDEYFGPVSDVDGNGRMLALMTKEANRADVGGWVWSGDFYPREQCASSNEAEITYLMVPDPGWLGRRRSLETVAARLLSLAVGPRSHPHHSVWRTSLRRRGIQGLVGDRRWCHPSPSSLSRTESLDTVPDARWAGARTTRRTTAGTGIGTLGSRTSQHSWDWIGGGVVAVESQVPRRNAAGWAAREKGIPDLAWAIRSMASPPWSCAMPWTAGVESTPVASAPWCGV